MDDTDFLYHVSDRPGISMFEPCPADSIHCLQSGAVWAIDRKHLPNYLLPRDCPRVTFMSGPSATPEDIDRFLRPTGAAHVIAIESAWASKLFTEKLYIYRFDPEGFSLQDGTAGYYTSTDPVSPQTEVCVERIMDELLRHDVELRVIRSLWDIREAVIKSSLDFSIIRMRNAQPPEKDYSAYYPLPSS